MRLGTYDPPVYLRTHMSAKHFRRSPFQELQVDNFTATLTIHVVPSHLGKPKTNRGVI